MRNKLGLISALALTLSVGFGCSTFSDMANSVSNGATTGIDPKAPETALRENTGVPECDAALNAIADQAKANDENWATRAAKELFFNTVRQSLKESIEKNKNNAAEMAKACTEVKKQIDAFIDTEKKSANK